MNSLYNAGYVHVHVFQCTFISHYTCSVVTSSAVSSTATTVATSTPTTSSTDVTTCTCTQPPTGELCKQVTVHHSIVGRKYHNIQVVGLHTCTACLSTVLYSTSVSIVWLGRANYIHSLSSVTSL